MLSQELMSGSFDPADIDLHPILNKVMLHKFVQNNIGLSLSVMLPDRAALVVIKIARMLINLSFTTQLIGLCAFASHLLHRKKHEVLSFSDCAALCQLALASHMNFPGAAIGPKI
jgi:hypothetical protein